MSKRGIPFILSGPAGCGKTTLVNRLVSEFAHICESVSCTTRNRRPTEEHGQHYHFLSFEEFQSRIKTGELLEYVQLFDHYYGTLRKTVEDQLDLGQHVFMVIDTQGALQLSDSLEGSVSIFLSPPSMEALEERLKKRSTESDEKIRDRLARAVHELPQSVHYDYVIVNDDFEKCYEELKGIVLAEERRNKREKK